MLISKTTLRVLTPVIFLTMCGLGWTGELSPKQTVQSLIDAVGKIKTDKSLPSEQKTINEAHAKAALALLDMAGVSRNTLGKYWKKRSPEEQKAFVALLSGLFQEVAFPNSAKFFSDLKVVYGDSKIGKNQATVPIIVEHKGEGEISIDFTLRKVKSNWRVVEVFLDGVSMRNNLRSQIYKVIAKNDYQELVRRMRNKLKKLEVKG